MRTPVMQQEWQRRQMQRSVWMLLGIVCLVAAAPELTPVVVPSQWSEATSSAAGRTVTEAPPQTRPARVRSDASTDYWRVMVAAADAGARLKLHEHAIARPVVSSVELYLRRFLRGPTA